jgi:arylsulfatase A-like enzyme
MRYDALHCNGNNLAITPNLDSLAKKGTNFTNFYVTSAICCISRASYLTGMYERKHGINDFDKSITDKALLETYPLVLKQNGYYIGFIGKYGVGKIMPQNYYDYWKGFAGHGSYFYKEPNGSLIHETALMGNQIKDFILNRDATKPFCLSVSFKAPHSEDGIKENNGFRPDPYFKDWFKKTPFPLPATYSDSFYFMFSKQWRTNNNKENEARKRFYDRFSTYQQYQTTTRAIYQLVSGIDKVVGELNEFLKLHQLENNTIIIFASDNGYYMGEHGLEGKWYGHQESIKVPLIVYNPLLKKQQKKVDDFVLNIDIAPTILNWAGIKPITDMQGKSFAALLTKPLHNWRKDFFYEHRYDPGTYPVYIPKTVGVVTKKYKYMCYYNYNEENCIYEEFFERSNDPYEMNNLINKPSLQQQIKLLKTKLIKYKSALLQ